MKKPIFFNIAKNYLLKIFSFLTRLIYPNQCLLCDTYIDEDAILCTHHFNKVQFISDPKCISCSVPLNFDAKNIKCISCLSQKQYYDSSVIIFLYENNIANMILSLKYNDNTYVCKKLAKIFIGRLVTSDADNVDSYNIITAIPLHKKRLTKRKYNQSLILAKHIAKGLSGVDLLPDLLVRNFFTKTQEGLSERQRYENLKDAFFVNEKYHKIIKGKKIILVDDVVVTAATINSCSKAIKSAGAAEIKIVAIARSDKKIAKAG